MKSWRALLIFVVSAVCLWGQSTPSTPAQLADQLAKAKAKQAEVGITNRKVVDAIKGAKIEPKEVDASSVAVGATSPIDVRKALYRLPGGIVLPATKATSFVDCIDIANWTPVSTTEANETTLVRCGAASGKYSTTNSSVRGADRDFGAGTEKNFSGNTLFVRYYIDPTIAVNLVAGAAQLMLYADDTLANYWSISNLPTHEGWNEASVTPSMGAWVGTMSTWNTVRHARFYLNFPTGGGYFVLDELSAWPHGRSKGAVILQFDDGVLSSYTEGIRYLAKYGFPSVFYVAGDFIVEDGSTRKSSAYGDFCTWGEIRAAEALGALIATHAQTTMPTTSKADLREWIVTQKGYLIEHGLTSGVDYFAIPAGANAWAGGTLTEQEMMDVSREYFLHIRGTQPFWQNAKRGVTFTGNAANQPYYQRDQRWGWGYGATNATWQARIDQAIANKDVAPLFFHHLTASTDPTITQFKAMVDYIKSKVDAGTLEVITYRDLLK